MSLTFYAVIMAVSLSLEALPHRVLCALLCRRVGAITCTAELAWRELPCALLRGSTALLA